MCVYYLLTLKNHMILFGKKTQSISLKNLDSQEKLKNLKETNLNQSEIKVKIANITCLSEYRISAKKRTGGVI